MGVRRKQPQAKRPGKNSVLSRTGMMVSTSQMSWMLNRGIAQEDPNVEGLFHTSNKSYTWVPPYFNADGSVGGDHFEEIK